MSRLGGWVVAIVAAFSGCDRGGAAPDAGAPAGCDEYDLPGCEAACGKGSAAACEKAARLLIGEDDLRAIGLFERACALGTGAACSEAAGRLAPEDFVRRRGLLDKACEIGAAPACFRAAAGWVGADADRARKAFERGCSLDAKASAVVGAAGLACPALDPALIERAERGRTACERKEPGGCAALGDALRGVDEPRRADAYAKECALRGLDDPAETRAACVEWLQRRSEPAKPCAEIQSLDEVPAYAPCIRPAPAQAAPKRGAGGRKHAVRVGAIQWADPALSREIERGVKAMEGELLACYEEALAHHGEAMGRVTVRFVIDRLGDAALVSNGGSDFPDMRAIRCAIVAFGKLHVTPADGPPRKALVPMMFFSE